MENGEHRKLYRLFQIAYLNNANGKVDISKIEPFLDSNIMLRVVQKNGYISRGNEPGNTVKLLISGEMSVVRSSQSGFSNAIAQSCAPQICGMKRVLLHSAQNMPEIIALKQSVLLEINDSYFIDSLMRDGELAVILIQNLLQKEEESLSRMEQHICHSTSENTLLYLYRTWLKEHNDEQYEFKEEAIAYQLPLDNQFIASRLGVCPRTLVRAIKKLKEEQRLTVVKRKITLTPKQMVALKEFYLEAIQVE